VQHRVAVRGRELHRHLATLRAAGSAEVDVVHFRGGHREHVREVIRLDQPVLHQGKPIAIAELAKRCKDVVPFAEDKASQSECALVQLGDDFVDLRRYQTRDLEAGFKTAGQATLAIGFFGGAIGGGICELACKDDSTAKDIGRGALIGAGVILGVVLLFFIVDCVTGPFGCRD
jgi:hypothetical protein